MAPLLKCSLFILLAFNLTLVPVGAEGNGPVLKRQKREWILAPRQLLENHDYTGLEYIAKIRSDKENFTEIFYTLSGHGVDKPPTGVFGIDRKTGFVKIYSILDREEISSYHLTGKAIFANGSRAENPINLTITVLDDNDCRPVIKHQVGSVNESSAKGTYVMRVTATDADKENTDYSKIFYRILEQNGMFDINSQTGLVTVRQTTLDRETKDTYTLTIVASDLGGRPGGNSGTGTVEIKILDINDNIPTLEKESYVGSVEENTINVEVMRIKAIDMDLIHTDNWLAVFKIIEGNEAGYFSITTDSKTNEGIIMIHKALDYEEMKEVKLKVAVSNKAEYNFGSGGVTGATGAAGTSKSYDVKINVVNQKEGPRFQPNVKVVTISEDHTSVSINSVIANYAAIDSDTLQTATNVRYVKLSDKDNWLIIDGKTADIKLAKLPDRESKFLINGTYYAKIICITTDGTSKTATGTIAIQVEDFNDHCPKLTATTQTMCLGDKVIYVTAVDEDEFPNSAPFDFSVIQGSSKGKWTVNHFNETTAILRDEANLWPGMYKVAVEVKDQQGKSCADVQMIDITVCTCHENTKTCVARSTKTAGFGAAGILLLLLGLLLLFLVPLLLMFCLCGGAAGMGNFKAIPFDTKQQLISYHTEGQGEDKEIPLLHVPVEVDGGAKNVNTYRGGGYLEGLTQLGGAAGGGTFGRGALGGGVISSAYNNSNLTAENVHLYNQYDHTSGQMNIDAGMMTGQEHFFSQYGAGVFDGMALSEQFLGEYYSSKSDHAAQQPEQKDGLLIYDYEGQESLAGSVGCCSLLENDDDLAFLNDLGPKFKTLAEICQGSALVTESAGAGISVSPPRPVSPIRPSTHTHVHTHTETIRDRDRVNINTLNASNVASGSSTIVQEERMTERAQGLTTVPKIHVQDNVVIPSQTLLVQQPAMYYAATPMYVVDSKPQVVLVAGGAQQAVGQIAQVGLSQGLVQVGGLQGSQGAVLVDRQVGMGGVTGQAAQGLSQGTLSRSQQVLVVENGGAQQAVGQRAQVGLSQGLMQVGGLQGSQGAVLVDRQVGMGGVTGQAAQGLSQGTLSRSQQVLVVENGSSGGGQGAHLAQTFVQTGQGSAEQGLAVRGEGMQFSLGSSEDFAQTATPRVQGSQRVVVQHKKVSVTERNMESSSRA